MSERWLGLTCESALYRAPMPPPLPIHTSRCVVRCFQPGDGPRMFEAVNAKREALLPWLPWASTDHQTEEDSVYYVQRVVREVMRPGNTNFHVGIFDKRSGELLGGTGVLEIEATLHQAKLGYWIRGDRHGRGICSEALSGFLQQVFAPQEENGFGLRRLMAFVEEHNGPSIRICEKLGFRREGTCHQAAYLAEGLFPQGAAAADGIQPGYVNMHSYALLRSELVSAAAGSDVSNSA